MVTAEPWLGIGGASNDGDCWHVFGVGSAMGIIETYEPPGHGRRPAAPYTLSECADEVAALIRTRIPSGRARVLGVALGSLIGQHLLVRHAELIESAVLVSTSSSLRGARDRLRARAAEGLDERTVEETLGRWFSGEALEVEGHPGVDYARACLRRTTSEAWSAMWFAMAEHHDLDGLARCQVPVTVVRTMQDQALGTEGAHALARMMSNVQMVDIAAPHMAHLESPGDLLTAVAQHEDWVREAWG